MAQAIGWAPYDALKAQGLSNLAIACTDTHGPVTRDGRFKRRRVEEGEDYS